MTFSIDPSKKLLLSDVAVILDKQLKIELSDKAKKEIVFCREYLDNKIKNSDEAIYGINTGFGSLYNVKIPATDLEKLQENLVKSHACGMGEEVPAEIVKLMLLLKIQALSYGKSGVSIETVERLVYFFNNNILPEIFQQGSLGASGDLAPLAHFSLPLLGLGNLYYKGQKRATAEVYKELKLAPLKLKSKEGLALLNGTQFMSAYGVWCCLQAKKFSAQADLIGAVSLEAYDGRKDPFTTPIHSIRPHSGQVAVAKNILSLLERSEMISSPKKHVQDPYSFRCIPQVHGASKDVIDFVCSTFETEINSVTDNPTVFPESDEVISGGNFHGQPLAIGLDFLCIALSELASISERRVYLLISGQRGLPTFLTPEPGLNSGLMITQYTAAGIVSQNKQLCTPASVDSIVSSNGQEDHVSMGANAATKCFKVVENTKSVLAIEVLNACQAFEFRRPKKSSVAIENFVEAFRKKVSFIKEDVLLHTEMHKAKEFLEKFNL